MNKKTLIIQLALLSLLVCASHAFRRFSIAQPVTADSSDSSSGSTDATDPYIAGICTSEQRCVKFCPKCNTNGSVIYNNGTCVYGNACPCMACSNPDVFAVLVGKTCPSHYPGLCAPRTGSNVCPKFVVNSCVCKENGKCSMQETNFDCGCQQANVLAVFQGQTCPSKRLDCQSSKQCTCEAN